MAGTLFPTLACQLVATHEVLVGQHRVFLVPNDGLAEVQSAILEDWWEHSKVDITAPDVEGPSR